MSNFDKQLEEELEKLKKKKKTLTPLQNALTGGRYSNLPTDDIAPVLQNAVKKATEKSIATVKKTVGTVSDDERTWFQKGAFEDGYQFGDITKTILGSSQDLFDNALTGVLDIGEKAVDALATIAPYIAQGMYYSNGGGYNIEADRIMETGFKQAKKETAEFVEKDLYDAEKVAQKLTSSSTLRLLGADTEKGSVFGEKSDSLAQSAGQLGAQIGTNLLLPGSGMALMGVTAFGGESENALKNGATLEEAAFSGAISAGAEILTEKIGGISFGGKTLTDAAFNQLSRHMTGKLSKVLLTTGKVSADALSEGGEEILSGYMSAIGQKLSYMEEKEIEELFSSEDLLDSFIGGVVLGGAGGVGGAVKSAANGVDYVTELTKNEQKVVEKVYKDRVAEAEKKGKISGTEKSKIYDDVLEKMEKGYLSTDDIESALGDRSAYDALQKESEEFKTLYETESGKLSKKQQDRLAELEAKNKATPYETALKDAKSKYSKSVFNLVRGENKGRGSRLLETYNEKARMGQDFQADFEKYKGTKHEEAARKTIESAIQAGANNTNRVHDLVDMAAQISADTGRTFYFKSGEQIKTDFLERQQKVVAEMESIPEAKRTAEQTKKLTDLKDLIAKVESGETVVNGDITEDGITLNLDSTKPLNRTVGHEVTHSLEKAKSYKELKDSLFAYAKTKGIDIESELNTRKLMYEGITDANPEAELVSDLVGDFLFTDSNYIKKLSTENRNVFQKIWDEVKYLYSVATAGSQEARELAKVKKAFEDAYRESGSQSNKLSDSEVKHSLGYHAGDLGKSEGHHMQGGGRSTGHFGTGTYFVSNPKALDGYNTRNGKPAPIEKVDLDNYNLYRIYSDEVGLKLHRNLQVLDGGVTQEFLDAAKRDAYSASDLRRKANELADSYDNEVWNEDLGDFFSEDYFGAHIRAYTETLQENGVEFQSFEEWYNEYSGESPTAEDYDDYKVDYYDYLKDTIAKADEERNDGYPAFSKAYFDLWLRFGKKQTDAALQNVVDHINKLRPDGEYNYDLEYGQDSNATVFMKSLGYEGIDVSGTGLDNTTYGSVVYDLKGEDLARKKEIGTAKYSISDSDGKKLTKEQQEYFKDSKMRDENGNLKVMYHGSKHAGFHVFDAQMSDDDISFFFTDSNEVASSYSRSKEVYEARTFHTAKDMNKFLAEIGYDDYEVVKSGGKYTLYYDVDEAVATSDNLKDLYDEFCDYAGVGEGEGNYKVYLNLKNPLVVDAEGRNWDNVSLEFYPELYEQWKNDYFTEEEKAALVDLAGWEDYSTFKAEVERAVRDANKSTADEYTKAISSAFWKHSDVSSLFSIASDNFSDDVLKAEALKQMDTRDYAQKAKAEGYDGVIFKNLVDIGEYGRGRTPSTVAIAFESNQIKSTANAKPTKDADIRYSLSSIANTFFGDETMTSEQFTKKDYRETQGYKDYVEQCLNNYRQTRADFNEDEARKAIEDSIEGIVRVAIASKQAGYDILDDANKRNMKDSKNRLLFSSLEPNSDYFTSNDISTICDKRKNFAEIYDDIVKAEEAKGVPKGKRFFDNVDNYFAIHKIMADKGLTTPCRQCYVESMRKNLAPMANAFLRLVQETNATNTSNDQLYHQSGKQKGELKTSNASTRDFVLSALEAHPEYNMSVSDLTVETLTTAEGLAQLKLQAPMVYEAFNSFYGQSKPKMPKDATPFRFGELTALLTDEKGKIKQSLVDKINSTGGFRLQSYSDFQIQNYTDVLQVLFEAGTLGLNGHAYTKVPAFLDATKDTNLKRNISIFMYKDGDEWKLDKNDSFPYDLEEIYDLVKEDKTGNTGIIAVSQNADMSAWIMANDYVGYGIPFHKSGLKMGTVRDTDVKTDDGRIIKGYSGTIDHTKQQTEVWAKAADDHKALTKVKKGINIYSFWDFDNKSNLSKNELIEKNVKAYIDQCELVGYLPKFRAYVMDNGKVLNDVLKYSKELGFVSEDATISDISFQYKGYTIPYGYYKFLGDFGMFTPDGKAAGQKTLSLENYDFDKAVEFFSDAETLRRTEILQQFANGKERQKYRDSDLTAEELQEIVKQKRSEVVEDVVPGVQNSLSANGEQFTPSTNDVYGKDFRVQNPAQDIAPVAENATTVSETESVAPVAVSEKETTTEELFPDDTAPIQEEYEFLLAEREDIIGAIDAYTAVGDYESAERLMPEYEEVQTRIAEIEADDAQRIASIEEADAPPEKENSNPEDVADDIPLTKALVTDLAKQIKAKLGIANNRTAEVRELIERYSKEEFPSKAHLYTEIAERFGIITETQVDEDLKGVKSLLRTYGISVDEFIKKDIADYGKFMRSNFGKVRFSKDGLPVDVAYKEFQEILPYYFPESINVPTDQLLRIVEVANMDTSTTNEYEIDWQTLEEATDTIMNAVSEFKQNRKETLAIKHGRESFESLMESADQYVPPYKFKNIAPTRAEMNAQSPDDIAPVFDTGSGQQAFMPEEEAKDDIAKRLDRSKAKLREEYLRKRADLESATKNKNAYISQKAAELYQELRGLRKGVRASEQLGYLLDFGYDWSSVRAALVNIQHTPDHRVNENSAIESIARKMLNEDYEDSVYEISKLEAEYERNVAQLEADAEKERTEGRKATRKELHENIVDNIKTTFREEGFDFDETLKNAKDLSTFATVDNTPQRVMEKALGYKQGQVLGDLTVNKVAQNETDGIKWLNSFTDRKTGLLAKISKQYKIKPGSKESAAAQMYAEGFYVGENDAIIAYGDKELAADFPDVKVQENIKKLARDPRIRQIYDETLAAINASRTRNAYPEIPRLDNYFLHFRAMEDTFSRLGLPFNPNDIRAKDLPTDLNGVTADLKPGQPYFASAKHRMGKRTSFDLLGGLEKYLSSAKNQIYHIDDIQTLRALRNYVAETYGQAHGLENIDTMSDEEAEQRINEVYNSHLSTFAKFLNEEANILAGKTSLIDRGLEGVIGRRGITFLDSLNKQVGANMVGFNVSSSLTNFLAPVQAFAKSNKFDFVKAMAQTSYNKIGSIFGKGDTFAEDSPVMIRRKGADRFYRTPFEKVGDAGYVFMSAVDDISTELVARTKYNELTRKGMDSQQAHYETDKWVSRLMGDRSLGQQPQLYNSKMLGLVTKFQLEVRNQLDSQFYDTIQEAKVSTEDIENGLLRNAKKAAKITSTFVQLAVAQHLFGKAFESVAGYNPAFDIIGAIIKAFGWDDEEESEDTVLDNIEQGFLELLGDLPYTSTLTGGRIPIESALPITELIKGEDRYGNEKSRWDTLKEVAPYYILPGGYGQLKKTAQGLGMFSEDHPIAGSYTNSGNLRFPVEDTLGNRIQAGLFGQYASGNARDYFDNERSPLKEKQIQEFIDVGMTIQDYWKYRDGLSKLNTLAEKADYISGLDLTTAQKNVLINNIADRKEDIDMSDYGNYGSFEEFDFAVKNPEKYSFLKENNVSYSQYKNFDEDTKDAYDWAFQNPEKFTMSKAVASDVATYRKYTKALNEIKADKDSSGKTISGSRKEKVIDYINNLDATYGEKIILYKSQYEADNTYNNDIVEYLNSRNDISYQDTVTILRELGFTVLSDGTVQW
jgi:hypothetical protein